MAMTDQEVLAKFPDVLIDQDNIEHYRGLLQRKLLINRCQECGYWVYPHRPMCSRCWSERVAPTEPSGKGTVYMYTILYQGPPGVDYPQLVPAVELREHKGLRYLAPLVNCRHEDAYIGMPVELTWIERKGVPAPAWQPAQPKPSP